MLSMQQCSLIAKMTVACLLEVFLTSTMVARCQGWNGLVTSKDVAKWLRTEDMVEHMEEDKYRPGNILFSEASALKTTDGQQIDNVVGNATAGWDRGSAMNGAQDWYSEGVGPEATFNRITGFTQFNSTSIVVVDAFNQCLRLLDRPTRSTKTLVGNCTRSGYTEGPDALFFLPLSVLMINDSHLYITDSGNSAIRIINVPTLQVSTLIKDDRFLTYVSNLKVEPRTGFLYILVSNGLVKMNPSTLELTHLTSTTQGFLDGKLATAQFLYPYDLIFIKPDVLMVADSPNNRIRVIDLERGQVDSICTGTKGIKDGFPTQCQLDFPLSFLYLNNTLYVGETKSIRKTEIKEILCPSLCSADAACSANFNGTTCKCRNGFPGDVKILCADVNECQTGADNCSRNAVCSSIGGRSTCRCEVGFEGDGLTCTDIDECQTGADNCSSDALCGNIEGGFTCDCKSGFEGDGVSCADIDECQIEANNCSDEAVCSNTDGGFTCHCKDGFEGDGIGCADIDECQIEANNCSDEAVCSNTDGGFICQCTNGFTGDGVTCAGTEMAQENYQELTVGLGISTGLVALVLIGTVAAIIVRRQTRKPAEPEIEANERSTVSDEDHGSCYGVINESEMAESVDDLHAYQECKNIAVIGGGMHTLSSQEDYYSYATVHESLDETVDNKNGYLNDMIWL